MNDLPTVLCVLKSGGDFRSGHVHALYRQTRAFWPAESLRFVVLTDEQVGRGLRVEYGPRDEVFFRPLARDWQGWWSKLELFAPEHDDLGDVLYFDLDTMIVNDLTDVVRPPVDREVPVLLSDFYRMDRINSGMMLLPVSSRRQAWAALRLGDHPLTRWRGDGDWLDWLWRERCARWQDLIPRQVVSFKAHCRHGEVPSNARVVCFHGRPRPWKATLYKDGRLCTWRTLLRRTLKKKEDEIDV